jgi:hypothetical protein
MDYTPISAARVLAGFALTLIVGLAPILGVVLHNNSSILGPFSGYGVLMLGFIAVAMALTGLAWLAVALARWVFRRPSRA